MVLVVVAVNVGVTVAEVVTFAETELVGVRVGVLGIEPPELGVLEALGLVSAQSDLVSHKASEDSSKLYCTQVPASGTEAGEATSSVVVYGAGLQASTISAKYMPSAPKHAGEPYPP
jgi:hypothetical protein